MRTRLRCPGTHQALCLLFLFELISGCAKTSRDPPGDAASAGTLAQQIPSEGKTALEKYIDAAQLPDLRYPRFENLQNEVRQFYKSTGGMLPWMGDGRPTPQARAIVQILEQAESEGLNPDDYDAAQWAGRIDRIDSGLASDTDLLRFDLALTISTMRYVSDLRRGRVNLREVRFDSEGESNDIDLSAFLEKLVTSDDVRAAIATVEPPFPAYRKTADALRSYLELAAGYEDGVLPPTSKPANGENTTAGLAHSERLLQLFGDIPVASPAQDRTSRLSLAAGIRHFQQRHGLEPSGTLDSRTVKELHTPLSERVLQLKLALERWRWLPRKFARPPIIVNIPEFRLYATGDDYLPALTMKVIVGRSYKHQTPVFGTELTSVIFRPYWSVPLDIQRKELLPELANNPGYLTSHSYEVVDSSGRVVSRSGVNEGILGQLYSGKLALRQRPGADNSLGLIKFDMPNVYDVYMHGTPAKQLFSRIRRDFSHGCIRVEDPVALAKWVLRDNPEWDTRRIVAAMNGATTVRVPLAKPIPVLVLYHTATVDQDGQVNFFDDIYGHDAVLAAALAKGYPYTTGE